MDGRAGFSRAGLGLEPLTARSVAASLLLGSERRRLPVGLLVGAAGLFGIEPGATRTALSRMIDHGEATTADGWYELAGRLAERAGRQQASRHRANPSTGSRWKGDWYMIAAPAEHFAQWREGLWLRPATGDPPAVPEGYLVSRAEFTNLDPPELASQLWDLRGWAQRADALRGAMRPTVRDLEAGDVAALPDGFVIAAAAARHLLSDPRLPAELMPETWPADALRAEYDAYEHAFQSVLRDWYRAHRD
jgi:phenylacetic acid degradation operon negative regulatory protein